MSTTKKPTARAKNTKRKRGGKIPDVQRQSSEVGYKRPPKEHQFKPGQSGNPAGRPKSALLSDAMRRLLPQPVPGDKQGRTYAEAIAETLCKEAASGNVTAAREIADRTEGRAKQTVDVNMPKTEAEKYEAMIDHMMRAAEAKDSPITREQAIEALAVLDPHILEVVELASESVQ